MLIRKGWLAGEIRIGPEKRSACPTFPNRARIPLLKTSAEVLEFESLLQLVGRYVASPMGRRELEKVEPHTGRERLIEDLAEAGEAIEYLRSPARHYERFAVERNERWKRQPSVFIKLRHADRVFIAAQEKNVRMAVAVPIRRRELAHTGQGGKSLGRGERTVRLLEINRKLAAGRLGHEQIRASVAVGIGPKQAALRRVRLVQRQNLKLSAPERAGQNFGGLARELRNRRASGIPRDGHDVIFAATFEGVRG